MVPPATQTSFQYKVACCPGVTANWGVWNCMIHSSSLWHPTRQATGSLGWWYFIYILFDTKSGKTEGGTWNSSSDRLHRVAYNRGWWGGTIYKVWLARHFLAIYHLVFILNPILACVVLHPYDNAVQWYKRPSPCAFPCYSPDDLQQDLDAVQYDHLE